MIPQLCNLHLLLDWSFWQPSSVLCLLAGLPGLLPSQHGFAKTPACSSALLYHTHPPVRQVESTTCDSPDHNTCARPHRFNACMCPSSALFLLAHQCVLCSASKPNGCVKRVVQGYTQQLRQNCALQYRRAYTHSKLSLLLSNRSIRWLLVPPSAAPCAPCWQADWKPVLQPPAGTAM